MNNYLYWPYHLKSFSPKVIPKPSFFQNYKLVRRLYCWQFSSVFKYLWLTFKIIMTPDTITTIQCLNKTVHQSCYIPSLPTL